MDNESSITSTETTCTSSATASPGKVHQPLDLGKANLWDGVPGVDFEIQGEDADARVVMLPPGSRKRPAWLEPLAHTFLENARRICSDPEFARLLGHAPGDPMDRLFLLTRCALEIGEAEAIGCSTRSSRRDGIDVCWGVFPDGQAIHVRWLWLPKPWSEMTFADLPELFQRWAMAAVPARDKVTRSGPKVEQRAALIWQWLIDQGLPLDMDNMPGPKKIYDKTSELNVLMKQLAASGPDGEGEDEPDDGAR